MDGRQYYIVTERLYCGDSDKIVAVSPPLPLLLAEPIMEGAGGGCVVGGVAPLGQVEAGQDAGLAGHSRVDLVVGQHHGVHLVLTDEVTSAPIGAWKCNFHGPLGHYDRDSQSINQ